MCSILERHEFVVAMTGLIFARAMTMWQIQSIFNGGLSTAEWTASSVAAVVVRSTALSSALTLYSGY